MKSMTAFVIAAVLVSGHSATGVAEERADGSHRSPAQLAIIPGATHYDIVSKPALAAVVGGFLGK
jgi:hypothetical protein